MDLRALKKATRINAPSNLFKFASKLIDVLQTLQEVSAPKEPTAFFFTLRKNFSLISLPTHSEIWSQMCLSSDFFLTAGPSVLSAPIGKVKQKVAS